CYDRWSTRMITFTHASQVRIRRGGSIIVVSLLAVTGPSMRPTWAQSPSTATIPGSAAAGVTLGAAANYKTSQDSKWKEYEDVVILNILTGLVKAAANAGQQLTAAQYSSVSTQ